MPVPNEEFESAFDDASKDVEGEAAAQSLSNTSEEYSAEEGAAEGSGGAAEGETAEGGEAAEAEAAEGETAEGDEAAEGEAAEGEAAKATPPATEAEPAPGTLSEDQIAAAYRRMKQEDEAAASETPPAETADPRQKTWRDYVAEESREVLESYETEWGEVSQAEQIKRDAQLQHVQDVVYSDLKAVLAPIVEQLNQSKVEAHFNSIRTAHSDFDELKGGLNGWVNEQPEFVRPAFEQVLKQGSAEQVVDLVNAYKQATGKTGAAPEVPASSASNGGAKKPQRKPPSEGAKRALAATPSTKRKDPPRQADPDNFSDAFDEAARTVGGI